MSESFSTAQAANRQERRIRPQSGLRVVKARFPQLNPGIGLDGWIPHRAWGPERPTAFAWGGSHTTWTGAAPTGRGRTVVGGEVCGGPPRTFPMIGRGRDLGPGYDLTGAVVWPSLRHAKGPCRGQRCRNRAGLRKVNKVSMASPTEIASPLCERPKAGINPVSRFAGKDVILI